MNTSLLAKDFAKHYPHAKNESQKTIESFARKILGTENKDIAQAALNQLKHKPNSAADQYFQEKYSQIQPAVANHRQDLLTLAA